LRRLVVQADVIGPASTTKLRIVDLSHLSHLGHLGDRCHNQHSAAPNQHSIGCTPPIDRVHNLPGKNS